jgi:CrcB protein
MASIVSLLWLMFGGALGAICRYWTQELIVRGTKLPGWVSIFVANVLGSFLIGLAAASLQHKVAAEDLQHLGRLSHVIITHPFEQGVAILVIGFCGAYTTFSSFALDNYFLLQGRYAQLAFNMLGSLVVAFLAVWAGWSLGQMFFA